jgi:hypothetical protein
MLYASMAYKQMQLTMASWKSMRKGRDMTTVITYFSDFFCRSVLAMMFGFPVSSRSLFAFLESSTGRYDSGMYSRDGRVASAVNVPTAKTHRHDTFSATNPLIAGLSTGPRVVATMKYAIAWPLEVGSLNTSAYSPPTMAMGAEAKTPHRKRKIRRAGQFGATAHDIVKMVKNPKLVSMTGFRP